MLRGVQSFLQSFLPQCVNRREVEPRGREIRTERHRLLKRHDCAHRDAYKSSAGHRHHALSVIGEWSFRIKLRRTDEVLFRVFELGYLQEQEPEALFSGRTGWIG